MKRIALALVALAALSAAGCEPKFQPTGRIGIDGMPFSPTQCSALRNGGVVLTDAAGTKLVLELSPKPLEHRDKRSGAPQVRLEQAGKPAADLGPCGSLALTGEAYHAGGRRAVSGHATLACSGAANVKGELDFEGCF